MENFLEAVLILAGVVIGITLPIILGICAVNAIHIAWVIGDQIKLLILEAIDKKFKQLRKEIDGD